MLIFLVKIVLLGYNQVYRLSLFIYLFIGIVVYLFFVWSLDGVNSVSHVIWGPI